MTANTPAQTPDDARTLSAYDRAMARKRVRENQRPHWRRWLRMYQEQCGERNVDPTDEANQAPFLERLVSAGREPWQCEQAEQAVGLYYEITGGYRQRTGRTRRAGASQRGALSEPWDTAIDNMTATIATKRLSESTRRSYTGWVRRFAKANRDRDPATLTAVDARLFLEALALKGTIAASTQNIAFNALLFLYKNVLSISLEGMGDTLRAKRPRTLPVVFTVEEARACLAQFEDPYLLVAELLYGCGLRLHEGLTIRVQDLDLDNRMLTVRRGKGNKDRTVPLPESLVVRLRARLRQVRRKHEADCREIGFEGVTLPRAMQSRDARSRMDFAWYWLFPAAELSETDTGVMIRSHMHPRASQRAMRTAVERAGIAKRATPHTFRHSFATHLLLQGANICQVQQALGHADVRTTMIYLQVANLQAKPVVSPLDRLYGARGGNTAGTNGSQGKEVGRQEMD